MTQTQPYSDAIEEVYISMPVRKIDGSYMSIILQHTLHLEIGLDPGILESFTMHDFRDLAEQLKKAGVRTTVHAPFNELFLGAPDRLIREAAIARMDYAFNIAELFSPKAIVVHLNFEERRFRYLYDEWMGNIIPNLKRYADRCGEMGAVLSLENVYEEVPDAVQDVFTRLKGYPAQLCLDVGHVSAFSDTSLGEWLEAAGPYIGHFHLHDNDGTGDQHQPIGTGIIDFDLVGKFIASMESRPLITLEPHTEENIWKTLKGFSATGLLDIIRDKKTPLR
ncbi:MAG TPA: sugar phosphate isomerase/epimerase family protein [Spirochaetota bacterium]|nr:sugar phosphate isomerase/epimerase family protein [Spirochaetota bacterium]